MNEPEKIDPRELSPLALAFVGDSVLELLVRQRLVEHHRLSAGKLNAEKVKYVSARAQFREEQLLEPLFTEDELAVFKRGRNASKASVAKHASPEEYRASTGFECLLGWLYLNGRLSRVHELSYPFVSIQCPGMVGLILMHCSAGNFDVSLKQF